MILFFIGWLMLTSPLLEAFTGNNTQPYRYLSLIVFFAVGVGVLLKSKNDKIKEIKEN